MLTCRQCSAPISRQSKSGLCRTCCCRKLAADPETRAKAAATFATIYANPAYRARVGKAISATKRRQIETDPVFAAAMKEKGRKLAASRLGCETTSGSAEAKARIGAKVSAARKKAEAKRMAWCPAELLPEFKRLRRKLSFDDARQIIESRLTPFERQLQAIRNGAGITELRPIRRAASSFSETGVSPIYDW